MTASLVISQHTHQYIHGWTAHTGSTYHDRRHAIHSWGPVLLSITSIYSNTIRSQLTRLRYTLLFNRLFLLACTPTGSSSWRSLITVSLQIIRILTYFRMCYRRVNCSETTGLLTAHLQYLPLHGNVVLVTEYLPDGTIPK